MNNEDRVIYHNPAHLIKLTDKELESYQGKRYGAQKNYRLKTLAEISNITKQAEEKNDKYTQ